MEFRKVTLGDISIDGGKYGIAASAVEYNPTLHTYLRITDINEDGTLDIKNLKSVSDKKAINYILKENDIVFARTGNSTGKSYFYDKRDGELVYAGFLIKFSLNESLVNPKYIKYITQSQEYKGWVKNYSIGSTRGNINAKHYADLPILLPNRTYQDKVVKILEKLDNKIRVNINIIENLEQISQTLFKRWFIDFEFPNEEGQPYKSSGGKLVESELGEIPEGWEVKKLKDLTLQYKDTFNPKKSEEEEVYHYSLPAYDANSYPVVDKVKEIKSNKWIVEDNCVVFSKMNPKTPRVWLIKEKDDLLNVASSEFVVLKNKSEKSNFFIYNVCNNQKFTEYLCSNTTGSTNSRQRVTPTIALDFKLAVNEQIISKFSNLISANGKMILEAAEENKNLEKLRDTLLPKLLSGEIEIPDDLEV